MSEITSKLGLPFPEGLYSLTKAKLTECGASGLLTKYNSIFNLVSAIFPEYPILSTNVLLKAESNGTSTSSKKCPEITGAISTIRETL